MMKRKQIISLLLASVLLLLCFSGCSDYSLSQSQLDEMLKEAADGGYTSGYTEGQAVGYEAGLKDGQIKPDDVYHNGYVRGYEDAENKYAAGDIDAVREDSYNSGYNDGLNAAAEEVQKSLPDRYDEGYKAGKSDGYQQGYDAGKAAVSSYSAPSEPAGTQASAAAPEPEPQQPQQEPAPTAATYDYIINTNTGKFHYTWCKSVNKMAEKNKWYYTGTRDSVIGMGYVPCKNCNP